MQKFKVLLYKIPRYIFFDINSYAWIYRLCISLSNISIGNIHNRCTGILKMCNNTTFCKKSQLSVTTKYTGKQTLFLVHY